MFTGRNLEALAEEDDEEEMDHLGKDVSIGFGHTSMFFLCHFYQGKQLL